MSGNTAGDLIKDSPLLGSAEDISKLGVKHLKPVKYPVRLNGVAMIGRAGDWHRWFMLRPKYGGRYLFLLYPTELPDTNSILLESVHFPNFNSAPKVLEMRIPSELRHYQRWDWRLVKTNSSDTAEENDFELLDTLQQQPDGLLYGESAEFMAADAEQQHNWSYLIFEARPAIHGQIRFDQELDSGSARLAIWSCHQPFETKNGEARNWQYSEEILYWYRDLIEQQHPHHIWALGDTSYSDGTHSLNFVRQVYDKTGWHHHWEQRKDLLSLYRLNYRYHWSYEPLQSTMRNYPHIAMWDDHELRDGYGSDINDFTPENKAIKDIASQAAEEYLFSWSPKLRSEAGKNSSIDNHQAYVNAPVASFIFDGRNSRNYGENLPIPAEISILASVVVHALALDPIGLVLGTAATAKLQQEFIELYRWHNPGEVISDQQLDDFARFCRHLKSLPSVKYLLMGNSVPFIYVMDILESIASEAAVTATDLGLNIRDDIRDSWHSPANRRQLLKLIDILRDLHHARPDIELINLSGDIHISNAFVYQPSGFNKPLYQITSSALTNRPSVSGDISNLLSIDGPLSLTTHSSDFGPITRLWHEGDHPNIMLIDANESSIRFRLKIFNREDDKAFGARDKILTIRPQQGFELES